MKHKMKVLALLTSLSTLALPVTPVLAAKNGWMYENTPSGKGWVYYRYGDKVKDGICWIDDGIYGFDEYGKMITGLYQPSVNDNTYYFKPNGTAIEKDWKQINGKWYWFDGACKMVKNQLLEIDGATYYFNEDGSARTGWSQLNSGKWVYYRSNCKRMEYGWIQINGKWYFFQNAQMKTGWLEDGGKKYYLNKDGAMVTGKVMIDKIEYLFAKDGALIGEAEQDNTVTPNLPGQVTPNQPVIPEEPDEPVLSDITLEEYLRKVNEFISMPQYQDEAPWGRDQKPLIRPGGGLGCGAYALDFAEYVFGDNQRNEWIRTKDASTIRSGDQVTYSNTSGGHAFVVLRREGNRLWTAEGNVGGKIWIRNTYRIEGDKLYEGQSTYPTPITIIYHYQNSFE